MPSAKPKSPEDTHDAAVDDNEQPFLDHLIELRSRILKSFVAVGIIFLPIYFFRQRPLRLSRRTADRSVARGLNNDCHPGCHAFHHTV